MNIITITDASYRHMAIRLAASLRRTNPAAQLRVFCPNQQVADSLRACPNVQPDILPEIQTLGVKRAKFLAYQQAVKMGGFLYLDADTLVLADVRELTACDTFSACSDDLSGCDFITDKTHPYPAEPGLEARIYINSGVFSAPASWKHRFDELASLCMDDITWHRYILPGLLYDNHFLCAWINLWGEPITTLDPESYNWQGLHQQGASQVSFRDGRLWNKQHPTKQLKIAHFAGIRNIDAFLASLDPRVGAHLVRAGTPPEAEPVSVLFNGLAGIDIALASAPNDQQFIHVASAATNELNAIAQRRSSDDWQDTPHYLKDPDYWLGMALTTPSSKTRWNQIKCGGYYLDADEYVFLRQVVQLTNTKTIIESGAGETSVLFRALGCQVTSLEYTNGPWCRRAEDAGARVIMTRLETAGLPCITIANAYAAMPRAHLAFVDSPSNSKQRILVSKQMIETWRPQFLVFHDAWRDSREITQIQEALGLGVVAHYPSKRGLVILAKQPKKRLRLPTFPALNLKFTQLDAACVDILLLGAPKTLPSNRISFAQIRITNRSKLPISSHLSNPILIAYHWLSPERTPLVFDGLRTALPCILYPNDAIEIKIRIQAPSSPCLCSLQVDVVQEGVRWFNPDILSAPASHPIEII